MRQIFKALAFIAGIIPAIAAAQQFNTLPPNTVIGRLGTSAGPAQALPLSSVFSTSVFDQLSTTPGAIPYRGPGSWTALAPSTGLLFNNGTTPSYLSLPLGISNGGTGQTTAAAARASSSLNIDQYTGHGDSSYTILSTDRTVGTTAALTAARTWTLPAASSLNAGQTIMIADYFGGASATHALTIQRSGSDTINGATSATIASAYGRIELRSDGVSKWSVSSITQTLVSILSYGARCDGATDDSTAIQSWLTALPTAGHGYIPPGLTCLTSGIITVPTGASWSMYGATLKAKNSAAGNTCICFSASDQLSTGPNHIRVLGGTFDGNGSNRTSTGASYVTINAATDILLDGNFFINAPTGNDCISVGGDTTHGLSGRVYIDHFYINACGRNGIGVFGVNILVITNGAENGAVSAPGHGIDLEPDCVTGCANPPYANPNNYVTIQNVTLSGNGGCAISVNSAGLGATAVIQSQSMNVTGIGNAGTADFCQYSSVPATKAGHRFINAHGTFGGTVPAVDALP